MKPRSRRLNPVKKSNWVRTAGGYGDPSMEEMEEFNASGAGVKLGIHDVGSDPNSGVRLKRQKGAD